MITGKTLIDWGFRPGPHFPQLLGHARKLAEEGLESETIKQELRHMLPVEQPRLVMRDSPAPLSEAIAATCEADLQNIHSVRRFMHDLLRVPCIERGAIMPDACPAGAAAATIPVGGAIAVRDALIPSAHSADICCSMQASFFASRPGDRIGDLLDVLQAHTRFGVGGRKPDEYVTHPVLTEPVWDNPFLTGLQSYAAKHLCDQGDGNHFSYIGALVVSPALLRHFLANGYSEQAQGLAPYEGQTVLALVTHHGSRGLGAQLYKRGQAEAIRQTEARATGIPAAGAWIDFRSPEGGAYWEALQYVERWTRANHELIHTRFLQALGRAALTCFGNAHNFVWRRPEPSGSSIFLHGKGATPAWTDTDGRPLLGLIPLNMAAPILIVLGGDNREYLSFCPHGAGRNFSRSHTLRAHEGREEAAIAEATRGIEVRWYCGKPDLSETPLGYKSAAQVKSQIQEFKLATVISEITPLGCIMAGDAGPPPWMKARA